MTAVVVDKSNITEVNKELDFSKVQLINTAFSYKTDYYVVLFISTYWKTPLKLVFCIYSSTNNSILS